MTSENRYRGWLRPGPVPPGGVKPEENETLDFLAGHWRIFQYAKGHRYSTDDVLTAWYGTQWSPRAERVLDLGSGIGSVALIAAWRLPGARFCTIEAQDISIRLARKSVAYNGLTERFSLYHGDIRDETIIADEAPFDLVLGSPPYFPPGTASEARHAQAIPARVEVRGDVSDYARAAARHLAPGGLFAFVFPTIQLERALRAVDEASLVTVRRRDVVFKEGEPPLISLFACMRKGDLPAGFVRRSIEQPLVEPPLVIRDGNGVTPQEYSAVRLSFGFPPGNAAADEGPGEDTG